MGNEGKIQIWRVLLSVLLVLVSGVLSSWFFYHAPLVPGAMQDKDQFLPSAMGIMPGIFYTSASILILIFYGKTSSLSDLLKYILLMVVCYVVLFLLTYMTIFYAFIFGIFTCSIGAWIHFFLVNRYVVPVRNSSSMAFICGGIPFIVNDLLMLSPAQDGVLHSFGMRESLNGVFTLVIFFWQIATGTRLIFMLQNANTRSK